MKIQERIEKLIEVGKELRQFEKSEVKIQMRKLVEIRKANESNDEIISLLASNDIRESLLSLMERVIYLKKIDRLPTLEKLGLEPLKINSEDIADEIFAIDNIHELMNRMYVYVCGTEKTNPSKDRILGFFVQKASNLGVPASMVLACIKKAYKTSTGKDDGDFPVLGNLVLKGQKKVQSVKKDLDEYDAKYNQNLSKMVANIVVASIMEKISTSTKVTTESHEEAEKIEDTNIDKSIIGVRKEIEDIQEMIEILVKEQDKSSLGCAKALYDYRDAFAKDGSLLVYAFDPKFSFEQVIESLREILKSLQIEDSNLDKSRFVIKEISKQEIEKGKEISKQAYVDNGHFEEDMLIVENGLTTFENLRWSISYTSEEEEIISKANEIKERLEQSNKHLDVSFFDCLNLDESIETKLVQILDGLTRISKSMIRLQLRKQIGEDAMLYMGIKEVISHSENQAGKQLIGLKLNALADQAMEKCFPIFSAIEDNSVGQYPLHWLHEMHKNVMDAKNKCEKAAETTEAPKRILKQSEQYEYDNDPRTANHGYLSENGTHETSYRDQADWLGNYEIALRHMIAQAKYVVKDFNQIATLLITFIEKLESVKPLFKLDRGTFNLKQLRVLKSYRYHEMNDKGKQVPIYSYLELEELNEISSNLLKFDLNHSLRILVENTQREAFDWKTWISNRQIKKSKEEKEREKKEFEDKKFIEEESRKEYSIPTSMNVFLTNSDDNLRDSNQEDIYEDYESDYDEELEYFSSYQN